MVNFSFVTPVHLLAKLTKNTSIVMTSTPKPQASNSVEAMHQGVTITKSKTTQAAVMAHVEQRVIAIGRQTSITFLVHPLTMNFAVRCVAKQVRNIVMEATMETSTATRAVNIVVTSIKPITPPSV